MTETNGTEPEEKSYDLFWLEAPGPHGLIAVLHADEEGLFFSLYRPDVEKIVAASRINDLDVAHDQLFPAQLIWSDDGTLCCAVIGGKARMIADATGPKFVSIGPDAQHWRSKFSSLLEEPEFRQARGRYWRSFVVDPAHDVADPELDVSRSELIVYLRGPSGQFAVFEDDGNTGYLHVHNSATKRIEKHVHLYDRSNVPVVRPEDVSVHWSADQTKCACVIFGEFRGIIDLEKNLEGRVWMQNPGTPGIADEAWLSGF